MITLYVKKDLWGIPAGSVERFRDDKAEELLALGAAEVYDPRKHATPGLAPMSPPRLATIRTKEMKS